MINLKNRVFANKKETTYNITLIVFIWLVYILMNYFFWGIIINFLLSHNLFYIYILTAPIALSLIINKLIIKNKENDKKYIIIGMIIPIILYYLSISFFIYLAIKAFNKSSFPF